MKINHTKNRGFSLIEMMIAIVLLGLGMVMVATIFPVAWTRARRQHEITNLTAIVKSAEATVSAIGRVDGLDSTVSTFAGDLVFARYRDKEPKPNIEVGACGLNEPGCVLYASDTRVHVLSMDNLTVSPRGFLSALPFRKQPWYFGRLDALVPEGLGIEDLHSYGEEFLKRDLFTSSRIRLESRVHPPMRPRKYGSDFSKLDPEWDDMMDGRRYAWAVFHRLREPIAQNNPALPPTPAEAEAHGSDLRKFDLYYVMLRRPQSNYRYARQDPEKVPDPASPAVPVAPRALPPENDVVWPEPWRVQVHFNDVVFSTAPKPGIPTEVVVNGPSGYFTHSMLTQFFAPGTQFIDEVSGLVLRVEKRRYVEGRERGDGDSAVLTLDRSVQQDDLLIPTPATPSHAFRTVWVFPPPVQLVRAGEGIPVFEGSPPVAAIERRALSLQAR